VKRSNVLDNAFVSNVRFAEFDGECREVIGPDGRIISRGAGQTRLQAEWTAKMNKAFERGLAQGEAHAAEKPAQLVKALGKARGDLAELMAGVEVEAEKQAVELALKLAETVIRTQVLFDANILRSALNEAVQRAPEGSILRVRVNPNDLAAAESQAGALTTDNVEITSDADVGRGGCVVETKLGDIDSTIEHRWEAAEKLLREASPTEEQDV